MDILGGPSRICKSAHTHTQRKSKVDSSGESSPVLWLGLVGDNSK